MGRNLRNRSCARFLLACSLAKVHDPTVDIRKPYTKIGDSDTYSGRVYDEQFITDFINEHHLPCGSTTAFLTPAFRNRNITLTPDVEMEGNPPALYRMTLQLLDNVHRGNITAEDLLAEMIRWLLVVRDEKQQQLQTLLAGIQASKGNMALSAEAIVNLLVQHLSTPGASRLPVLIIAAAYRAASNQLGERILSLQSHNAADEQTGALGDVEITLINDDSVITTYEMKMKRVLQSDIERAVQKLQTSGIRVDNYIFITTDIISDEVVVFARNLYEQTGGIEFVILDCIGFIRHFLHLFHRLRTRFLDEYQDLVLAEPESAVGQPVKVAFLALRQAAESS